MMLDTEQTFFFEQPSEGSWWRPVMVIVKREIRDTLRDWRIIFPIVLLVFIFPFLAEMAATFGLNFVNRYGAGLIIERLYPFLMLVVGFFPTTFSLVIALETFVGEKERRSLEPLLALPLTNFQLYIGKLLATTLPPLLASYVGMLFYLLLLGLSVGWWPSAQLMLVGVVLATAKALVMVTAAVIVSSQSTSVRAANLVASFIIVPMTMLLQVEAGLLLFANYGALWLVALALVVVDALLVRLGMQVFNRESLLGREIDFLDIKGIGRTFWEALWPRQGLVGLYRREIPQLLRAMRPELLLTVLVVFGGSLWIGYWGASRFPIPAQYLNFNISLDMESFERSAVSSGLLSEFSAWAIWFNNIRSLVFGAFLGLFTFGILAQMLLMAPLVIIAYFVLQVGRVGLSPWMFLAVFVLPHGLFELPAAVMATAQAMRIGDIILRPPEKGGGVMGMVREIGHFLKLLLAVVIPLLLIAALIEAWVTPRLVIWYLGSL